MAEAILRKLAGAHFDVYSAGFDVKDIDPMTFQVMEEKGYDLTGQKAKKLEEYLGKIHFGVIITVCNRAEEICPTFPGVGTRIYWPIDDPAAMNESEEDRLNAFRKARDQLEDEIKQWLKHRDL